MSKYKVGDKFVVEIESVNSGCCGLTGNLILSNRYLDSVERLDSDYVNEYFGDLQDEAYNKGLEKGLEDAWELAKQVTFGFSDEELKKIFGTGWVRSVLDLAPQEALAKLKDYEDSKIEVGDVVILEDEPMVVTRVAETVPTITIDALGMDGNVICWSGTHFKKTGKHINLEQILKEIGANE